MQQTFACMHACIMKLQSTHFVPILSCRIHNGCVYMRACIYELAWRPKSYLAFMMCTTVHLPDLLYTMYCTCLLHTCTCTMCMYVLDIRCGLMAIDMKMQHGCLVCAPFDSVVGALSAPSCSLTTPPVDPPPSFEVWCLV